MNRLKFLLFAVIAIGLWSAQLAVVSPGIGTRSVEVASAQAAAAPHAVALKLEAVRTAALSTTLKVAASTAAHQKAGKPEAPNAEKVNALRTVAVDAAGEAAKGKLVVGAVNDLGSLVAVGDAEPAASPEGFDAKAAGEAGAGGAILNIAGAPHLFYSAPLLSLDKQEVATVGQVFVGLPLALDAAALDQLSRELGVVALGLSAGGNLVVVGGLDKKALETLLKTGKLGQATMLGMGSVRELGPLKLPAFTASDPMGGQAALTVGFRRDVVGTPFEVLAVASTRASLSALADLQAFAVLSLFGLLLLAVAVALLITPTLEEEPVAVVAPQRPRPATVAPAANAPEVPESLGQAAPEATDPGRPMATSGASPISDGPLGEEAHPDDFQFGGAFDGHGTSAPPVPDAEPGLEPLMPGGTTDANPFPSDDGAGQMDPFAELNAQSSGPPVPDYSADDGQRTVAYPVTMPPPTATGMGGPVRIDAPFAQPMGDPDFNPDQTRVAAVPKELLKASQRVSGEVTAVNPKMLAAAMPRVAPGGGGDDQHWQDVFRDFVAMREKCGEPADGLTYDKFSAKLRKNKEQLVAKYNCRTVRFQVHSKDGKAALKATPVRD